MKKKYKSLLILFGLILIIIGFSVLFHYLSPSEIVNSIGIRNAYVFAFFISLFGGLSAFGSFSFMATIVTFVLGGVNPWMVGIISGVALSLGDLFLFYVGSKGREAIKGEADKKIKRVSNWIEKRPRFLIPAITFVYMALTPFPNDILLVSLAMIKYPTKKLVPIFVLADITFATGLALLASIGIIV